MVEALCNKCRAAPQLKGDSWCLACTACESISCELRARWGSHELRRLAADQLVDQSKAVKTLRILSLRLRFEGEDRSGARSGPSTGAGHTLGATGKAKPGPPPILKEAPAKDTEGVEEEDEVEVYEEESEYSYQTSEEEDIDTRQEGVKPHLSKKPESPKKGAGNSEVGDVKKEKKRKSQESEKVERKTSKKREGKESKERTRRRGRRGGSKHQQVHRQRKDPNLRVHRKKSVEQLQSYKERKEPPYPPPGKEWRR